MGESIHAAQDDVSVVAEVAGRLLLSVGNCGIDAASGATDPFLKLDFEGIIGKYRFQHVANVSGQFHGRAGRTCDRVVPVFRGPMDREQGMPGHRCRAAVSKHPEFTLPRVFKLMKVRA